MLVNSRYRPKKKKKKERKKRCPKGLGPFVSDDKLGSLDKNGRKSSGDVSAQHEHGEKRQPKEECNGRGRVV
jgi:hypothetical protein